MRPPCLMQASAQRISLEAVSEGLNTQPPLPMMATKIAEPRIRPSAVQSTVRTDSPFQAVGECFPGACPPPEEATGNLPALASPDAMGGFYQTSRQAQDLFRRLPEIA
jgi:hypothetical protein